MRTGVSPGRWRASGAKGCVLSSLVPHPSMALMDCRHHPHRREPISVQVLLEYQAAPATTWPGEYGKKAWTGRGMVVYDLHGPINDRPSDKRVSPLTLTKPEPAPQTLLIPLVTRGIKRLTATQFRLANP